MTERLLSNRYRLQHRIGAGGMATVYSGLDTVLRRRVAIKELRPQFAEDEDFVKRFYTEAHHAAKLSHPNVVNIYDVGHEDDAYFIVMELVDGTTLAEMIEHDGRLPEPVVIDYATQICAGLAYAHRQDLLHRDIKPANILVTKDDVVKLSDFGIARAVTTQTVTVTQPGLVMGSVFYLSPEQAQGHELHETSDLYSLGVVLFQMLTGKLPYTGESPITVALKHVSSPVPPLETDDGSEISPALRAVAAPSVPREMIGLRTIPNPRPRPTLLPDRSRTAELRSTKGRRFAAETDAEVVPVRRFPTPPLPLIIVVLIVAFIGGFMLFSRGGFFGPSKPVAPDDLGGRRPHRRGPAPG